MIPIVQSSLPFTPASLSFRSSPEQIALFQRKLLKGKVPGRKGIGHSSNPHGLPSWDVADLVDRGMATMATCDANGRMVQVYGEQVSLDQLKSLGSMLLQRGKAAEALAKFEVVLALAEEETDALCGKGKCLQALQQEQTAAACFRNVLERRPGCSEALSGLASLATQRGALSEAIVHLEQAVEHAPTRSELKLELAKCLTDYGTQIKTGGDALEGKRLYELAVQRCPTYAPAYYNLGVLHSELGDPVTAIECYRKAVENHPSYAEAHCNLGVIYKQLGRLEDAIAEYECCLAFHPNLAIAKANLAIALNDYGTVVKTEGDLMRSIGLYERALSLQPNYTEAMYNLGVAYSENREFTKAIIMYEMASSINPNFAEAYNNLGVILKDQGNLERSEECYRAAIAVKPDLPQALNNLGVLQTLQGRFADALESLSKAVEFDPSYAEAYNNLGVLYRDGGDMQKAIASYETCLELMPNARNAGQNLLLGLNYVHEGEDPKVCNGHKEWGEKFQAGFERMDLTNTLDPEEVLSKARGRKPLKVGYISPDLFTHSVSYFAEAPLANHDPERISMFVYCRNAHKDSKTMLLKKKVADRKGRWLDCEHLTEKELAMQVQQDGIDILVELTGHTANNSLGTMAMKPAPVQVTWIGYPNSTGLPSIDYRFTDDIVDPIETTQSFVEELVRIPNCFLCYTPYVHAPDVSPLPALSAGRCVTFGSFNNLAKMTPRVFKLWARCMKAVPQSRLLIKAKPFKCDKMRNHIYRVMEQEGIVQERIDLLPLAVQTEDHLSSYSFMDISLDTFPYAGTTTTCESLYMGVPCMTLKGGGHAHNVGVTLMTQLGLQDSFVAENEDDYVAKAVAAVQDLEWLSTIRSTLREKVLKSKLCDAPGHVQELEKIYLQLWKRFAESNGYKNASNGSSSSTSSHLDLE